MSLYRYLAHEPTDSSKCNMKGETRRRNFRRRLELKVLFQNPIGTQIEGRKLQGPQAAQNTNKLRGQVGGGIVEGE